MRQFLFAAAAAMLFVLPARAQTPPDQTLRIALNEDPDILDPTLARTYVGRIVFAGAVRQAVRYRRQAEDRPAARHRLQWTDNRTLVINLRPGVTSRTARSWTPTPWSTADAPSDDAGQHAGAARSRPRPVEVVDPVTVRLVLKAPSAPFLANLPTAPG